MSDRRTLADVEKRRRSDATLICLKPVGRSHCVRPPGHAGDCTSIPYTDDEASPVGCYIDPDGNARPTLVAGIHMECEICSAPSGHQCESMAKRWQGDYGNRGRSTSMKADHDRIRKTLHKERAIAAKAESDRRVAAAAEYNARRAKESP